MLNPVVLEQSLLKTIMQILILNKQGYENVTHQLFEYLISPTSQCWIGIKHVKLEMHSKIIDTGSTNSYVSNFGVTEPNLKISTQCT